MSESTMTDDDRKGIAICTHVVYSLLIFLAIPAAIRHNNESPWITAFVLTLIAAAILFFTKNPKEIYKTVSIFIISIVVFNFVITKEYLQVKMLKESYNSFVKLNENYANTENAKTIKKAIDNYNAKNADSAYKVFINKDQNRSQDIEKVINLVNAIKEITPELKPDLKLALADNFISIDEYNSLKEKTIKNISLKTLSNEQLVLLGSIK